MDPVLMTQSLLDHITLVLWMPQFAYPLFKRLAWRWIVSATFHPFPTFRWAKVTLHA
jgi:hypothetical protein